jgi:hypothetical protein
MSGRPTTPHEWTSFVQNGAVHGWRNASDAIAIAFVIVGGQ